MKIQPVAEPALPPLSAPLVGREVEQRVLSERLRAVAQGQRGLVLIGGEAGIGKTTLVDWLRDEARQQGAQVLIGQCYDLTQAPPYGPWHDAFAVTSSQSSEAYRLPAAVGLGEVTSQSALFAQVRAYLQQLAAEKPVVLILEDLHWSDPASLELLRDVARSLAESGVLLVATYRFDELTRKYPLFLLLPHLVREARAERIDLSRLSAEEVRALVARRYVMLPLDEARLARYVAARSGGNPFYIDELLRTLESDRLLLLTEDRWQVGDLEHATVPPLVRQIIEYRLQQLAPETQRLLEVAAVIGQEIPLDLWREVGDADDDQLVVTAEQAIASHLLVETPDAAGVRFAHALTRDTLSVRQPLLRRRMTHRRVAELLATHPDPPLSRVASHFANADDPRAIVWLARAGEQALALYAARDAVAALTRAHELAGRFAQPLPPTAYRDRAAAYALLGEFDSARHDYELVLERARAAGDRQAEWQALVDLGMLWSERDYERTGTYGRAALELARSIGDELTIARSLNRIANWHVNREEPDLAIPLHQEALAIFERHDDRAGIADTLDLLGMAAYLSADFPASTAYRERAIALLRELDDRLRLASCLTNLGLTGNDFDLGIVPTFREAPYWYQAMEEGLEISRQIGWTAGEAFAHYSLSLVTRIRGDLGRALRHADAAERLARQIGHQQWLVAAHHGWGALWMELLQLDRAATDLERGLAIARQTGSRFWTTLLIGKLASVLVASGELEQAAALLGGVLHVDGPPRAGGQRQCWVAQIQLLLARHEPEKALALLALLPVAIPPGIPVAGPSLLLKLRGDALAQLEHPDEAEQAYIAARQSAALYGFPPLMWRCDEAHGGNLAAQGRAAEAARAYQRALATLEEMAATIPDAEIREELLTRARRRFQAPATQARGATSLSPRELDVLRQIVAGQSDREIAAALSISHRTVMRHVTGILTKLDVSSRTAAATLAVRQNLVGG